MSNSILLYLLLLRRILKNLQEKIDDDDRR